MSDFLNVDIAIVGGGIAGLWLLSHLRARGYGVLLIEGGRLGQGQTILSQGIIHGSSGYTLIQADDGTIRVVSNTPATWRECLAGTGELDLSGVRQLTQQQYLWIPTPRLPGLLGRLTNRFRRNPAASATEGDHYLAMLSRLGLSGSIYRLDEPVLDVASLLQTLADAWRDAIVLNQEFVVLASDGTITLRAPDQEPVIVRPSWCVFTAGISNTASVWAPVQVRTLHMVMVRGQHLPDSLYAHCLGDKPVPRLTITSHRAANGAIVWYLGGRLAEEGSRRRSEHQIRETRRELARLLPALDLADTEFTTLRTRRAEVLPTNRKLTGKPGIFQTGKVIVAWPVSLTMAPLLAEAVVKRLERGGLRPNAAHLERLADWPRPQVAAYPWDDERLVWQ
jgi:glycine/D-amino acid oxidase-like deaminating enzyme